VRERQGQRDRSAGQQEAADGRIVTDVAEGVGWIVFDNPARANALTPEMSRSLADVARRFDADQAVRVVVVRGAGKRAFMSGADIGRLGDFGNAGDGEPNGFAALAALRKPVVAMIRGWCLGGGLAMALAADLRLAADDARFGIPAARLGVGYPYELLRRLVAVAGPGAAAELLLTGEPMDAAQALRVGLLNRVVTADRLQAAVTELASTIAGGAPLTLLAAKAGISSLVGEGGAEATEEARRLVAACLASEDFVEGRRAFREKRPPRFSGR
jgi:enoyl-CoA hydratase